MEIKKEKSITMFRYSVKYSNEIYFVEVYYENDITEFYLTKKDYGVKNYMFGILHLLNEEEIFEYIDTNVEDYILTFKNEYEN